MIFGSLLPGTHEDKHMPSLMRRAVSSRQRRFTYETVEFKEYETIR